MDVVTVSRNEKKKYERSLGSIKNRVMVLVWSSAVVVSLLLGIGLYALLVLLIRLNILPWPEIVAIITIPVVVLIVVSVAYSITVLVSKMLNIKLKEDQSK